MCRPFQGWDDFKTATWASEPAALQPRLSHDGLSALGLRLLIDAACRVFRGLKPTAALMASRCEAGGGEQFAPAELEES